MVKTNIRKPGDDRPLPPGIGALRPRVRSRPHTRSRGYYAGPTPYGLLAMPRRGPTSERLANMAEEDLRVAHRIADKMQYYKIYTHLNYQGKQMNYYRYPAACAYAPKVSYPACGPRKRARLEKMRRRIAAISCVIRRHERDDLAALEDTSLYGEVKRQMKRYVKDVWGEFVLSNIFRPRLKTLEKCIFDEGEDEEEPGNLHELMTSMKEIFYADPVIWLEFSLWIPVKDNKGAPARMTWEELMQWAISTLQSFAPVPSWFHELPIEEQLPIQEQRRKEESGDIGDRLRWNGALIEAYKDIECRFGPIDVALRDD